MVSFSKEMGQSSAYGPHYYLEVRDVHAAGKCMAFLVLGDFVYHS